MGRGGQGDRGHGCLLKLLDLLPFWINYFFFGKTNKKSSCFSALPSETDLLGYLCKNSKCILYDVLSKWLPILTRGKKRLFPLVTGNSLNKYKNTLGDEAWTVILSANLYPSCIRQLSR